MTLVRDEQSWWLTPDQRQLLLAGFADHATASRVRHEWNRCASIATVGPATMALVPLLFRRSSESASGVDELGPWKGVYRRTWYHNHLLLRDLAGVIARLSALGIKTLLPPDPSLLLASYNDIGLRPLDRLGIVIDPADTDGAADALIALGWKQTSCAGATNSYQDRTSIRFHDGATRHLELRWDAGAEPCREAVRQAIWSTAIPISVLGEGTLALNRTEQLLGTRQVGCWHPIPAGRWVADALAVLLSGDSHLDWSRVLAFSRPSRLSLWFHSRLSYLQNVWGVPIPPDVLEAIDHSPTSIIDRIEYRARRWGVPLSADSAITAALRRFKRWQDGPDRFSPRPSSPPAASMCRQ